jgi:hypothetical protein
MYTRITNGSGHGISEVEFKYCVVRGVLIEQAGPVSAVDFTFSFEKGNEST